MCICASTERVKMEDPRKCRPVGCILVPGKTMEQVLAKAISKHTNDKKLFSAEG